MKKSLCIDARMVRHSGIGTVIRNLVPHLSEAFQTTVLVPENAKDAEFQQCNLEFISVKSGIYSLKEQVEIPLKVPKTDLLWVPHYNVPVFPTLAEKLVVTVHDAFHLDFSSSLSLFKQLYAKGLMQTIARKADRILTVSQFSKNRLLAHLSLDPSKIEVVYNGIHWEEFQRKAPVAELPSGMQMPYYLWVGNVKPHKNLGLIVEALSRMATQNLPLPHLAIAGKLEGLITRESEAVTRILSDDRLKAHVHFLGEVSDKQLIALYQNALALLFPSLYEGFGLPPMEALAAGTLPVVSRIEVLEEIYSGTAVFIHPTDPQELIHFFQTGIAENEHLEKRKKGLELGKKMTWEKTAVAYIEAFNQIAAR